MPEAFENYYVAKQVNFGNKYVNSIMDNYWTDVGLDDSNLPIQLSESINSLADVMLYQGISLGKPKLEIQVQPTDKFRFRYRSEMMGTHGSLGGDGMTRKSVPQVKLQNFSGEAIIRCTLVTANEEDRMPHAHRLVRKHGSEDRDDPHDIEVDKSNNYTAVFQGMGIIHTAKKNLKEELIRKKKLALASKAAHRDISKINLTVKEEADIEWAAESAQKNMNLNTVALCFQAFEIKNGLLNEITEPVFSNAINNLKSALTGELKICRINQHWGSCEGNEEIFIFVEKVAKKNIKIKFFEVDIKDNETWSAYGKFMEHDVHHQYAIVFQTPPYKDTSITEPREVLMILERPTDGECSKPLKFTYIPTKKNMLSRKRARFSKSSSSELILEASPMSTENLENQQSNFNISADLDIRMQNGVIPEDDEFDDFLKNIANNDIFQEHTQSYYQLCADSSSVNEEYAENVLKKMMTIIKENSEDAELKLKKLLTKPTKLRDTPLHFMLRNELGSEAKKILRTLGRMPKFSREIVNLQNSRDDTPLHLAVKTSQSEIVESLLLLGADPTKTDKTGATPLKYATNFHKETYETKKCFDLLLRDDKSCNLSSLLVNATKSGFCHAVKSLIQRGANVHTETKSGKNILHIAIKKKYKDIICYLLNNQTKINVNKKTKQGKSAFYFAKTSDWSWKEELCTLLEKHGAEPLTNNYLISDQNKSAPLVTVKKEIVSEEEKSDDEDDDSSSENDDEDEENQDDSLEKELNKCQIKSEIQEIKKKDLMELASVLDETKGWTKLAEKTGLHYFIQMLNTSKDKSPSYEVINLALESQFSPEQILDILEKIGETKAAEKLSQILNVK